VNPPGVGLSINGSMPVGLCSLVGDLLLVDPNRDVYAKTVAKGRDLNDWGASVVLHRDKNVRQELSV